MLTQPSYFGTQEGEFSLSIASVAAFTKRAVSASGGYQDDPNGIAVPMRSKDGQSDNPKGSNVARGWLSRLSCNLA